jgi:hypothetical protein
MRVKEKLDPLNKLKFARFCKKEEKDLFTMMM